MVGPLSFRLRGSHISIVVLDRTGPEINYAPSFLAWCEYLDLCNVDKQQRGRRSARTLHFNPLPPTAPII
jgi:hypothetical protein